MIELFIDDKYFIESTSLCSCFSHRHARALTLHMFDLDDELKNIILLTLLWLLATRVQDSKEHLSSHFFHLQVVFRKSMMEWKTVFNIQSNLFTFKGKLIRMIHSIKRINQSIRIIRNYNEIINHWLIHTITTRR